VLADGAPLQVYVQLRAARRQHLFCDLPQMLVSGGKGQERTQRDVGNIQTFLALPLAWESRTTYRSHVCNFYAWCVEEGLLDVDPSARVPKIRRHRRVPRPITEADLATALRGADPRMRAWLLLMSYAGLRCLEVSALRPADLKVGPPAVLRLRVTKGGHEAIVPAHPLIVDALGALRVEAGAWWQVGPNGVSVETSRYLKSVGVDATAHQLRHYAGTAWYEASGHDLLTTQQLLRHASVASTQGYAQISPTRTSEVALAMKDVSA
jgi:integrase